ncbi:MAG: hypothetical protein ACTSW1_02880 [Candidatus Hodarchaeales archaeon]
MLMRQTIPERELEPLKRLFPTLTKKNFKKLQNGNYCVEVSFITTGKYACGYFDVLIEYPYNYPMSAPKVWVQKPKIPQKTPHIYEWDKDGHALICYLRPKKDWHFKYTSYEASKLIEIWLSTYCIWKKTGKWNWEEAGFLDHLF